jgi:hypothetical protein
MISLDIEIAASIAVLEFKLYIIHVVWCGLKVSWMELERKRKGFQVRNACKIANSATPKCCSQTHASQGTIINPSSGQTPRDPRKMGRLRILLSV